MTQSSKDDFDAFLEERYQKEEKKKQKKARLEQKKKLIDEIKSHALHDPEENKESFYEKTHIRGTLPWAYSILKSNSGSELHELKKHYFSLAQQYHPDRNNGRETQEMRDLNEAWRIIKIQFL